MEDDTFKRILQDKQFHLQIKTEQKEILRNVLERKDSMAECYQRVSERACVTSPLFGQGTTSYIFFLWLSVIHFHNHLRHLTLRKWCYIPLQHDFPLDPMISSFHIHIGK
jgi:hypothetical protein